MLCFVFSFVLLSHTIQNCMAFKIINISKDVPLNITTNSAAIKTVSLSFAPEEKKTHSKDVKIKTELELHEIMTDLDGKDMTDDYLKNAKKENFADNININNLTIDLSKMIYSKLTNILRKQIHLLFSKAFPPNKGRSSNSDNMNESKSNDSHSDAVSYKLKKLPSDEENSAKNEASVIPSQSRTHSARQFVFHPYLPYGKDVAPDEKISIHDVLPIKMVKFIKSMVEDAPWEQMFMKMVRMVVDQFVDKIIEKMFAHKEEDHDKWRSLEDDIVEPTFTLSKNVVTSTVRLRRSIKNKPKSEEDQDWTGGSFSTANRVSKEDSSKPKDASEEESWLDSLLDFLFPEDSKSTSSERKKRDATLQPLISDENPYMSEVIHHFLVRYLKFQAEHLTPESVDTIIKESIRHKIMSLFSAEMKDKLNPAGTESAVESHLPQNSKQQVIESPEKASTRVKRSTDDDTDKENDAERLWQANRRTRPSNPKSRNDCSLRRACNAGRLLSRLPSVQDITLQLKTYNNEPHWDALLWGMSKKRCSKIFCKRQRSPKGSRHHWDAPEKRHHRKNPPSTRSPRFRYDKEDDLTTIYPV